MGNGGGRAAFALEEGVVIRVGLERRIEIDEVHGFVFVVVAENRQVVAVIKRAHLKVEG